MTTRLDALKEDRRNADRIACEMGEHLVNDPADTVVERCIWALAVAVLHLTDAEIKRREANGKN